jgi:hypothetical protein
MVGQIELSRIHFSCPNCSANNDPTHNGYVADDELGAKGYLSVQVLRLSCFGAAGFSFDRAARNLYEYCGIPLCGETLRLACEREGQPMAMWQTSNPIIPKTFENAQGKPEFQMDGGKVNTTEGWREFKIATIAVRPEGEKVEPEKWDQRQLPQVTARFTFAALEEIEKFQPMFAQTVACMGIDPESSELQCLGDGAEWIWNAVTTEFPNAKQTLDIYHASEYIADASKEIAPPQSEEQKASFKDGQAKLIANGWDGACEWVGHALEQPNMPQTRPAIEKMLGYLSKHTNRLDYQSLLAEGRPIGSGMIEGNVKTIVLRMKARGARWKPENVDKMAAMCCLVNSTFWEDYWNTAL